MRYAGPFIFYGVVFFDCIVVVFGIERFLYCSHMPSAVSTCPSSIALELISSNSANIVCLNSVVLKFLEIEIEQIFRISVFVSLLSAMLPYSDLCVLTVDNFWW